MALPTPLLTLPSALPTAPPMAPPTAPAVTTMDEERILELICQLQHDEQYRNYSKTNKDVIAAALLYMVKKCDPEELSKITSELADSAKEANTSGAEDSLSDIFTQGLTQEEKGPEKLKANAEEQTEDGFTKVERKRPRMCISRWKGEECSTDGCTYAHPPYCRNQSCKEKKNPDCTFWHFKPKKSSRQESGNDRRGVATPSSRNPNGGKGSKRTLDVRSLKLKLANTQIALLRAQKKSARTSSRSTYAAVAAAQSMTALPIPPPPDSQATQCNPLLPVSTQETVGSQRDDIRHQVASIAEQLAALASRLRI